MGLNKDQVWDCTTTTAPNAHFQHVNMHVRAHSTVHTHAHMFRCLQGFCRYKKSLTAAPDPGIYRARPLGVGGGTGHVLKDL